jgi:hypothetical protein
MTQQTNVHHQTQVLLHQAHLAEEERRVRLSVGDVAAQLRPENTQKLYLPKQDEFMNWCIAQAYPSMTVTSGKLLKFLHDEVIGRERRPCGKKRKIETTQNKQITGKLTKKVKSKYYGRYHFKIFVVFFEIP